MFTSYSTSTKAILIMINSCLQPDDCVGVEERLDLGLRDAEAEVRHELLAGVRLDHP